LRGSCSAWIWLLSTAALAHAGAPGDSDYGPVDGAYRVHPGQEIQEALDLAAADPLVKRVVVAEGTYRPTAKGQALVAFTARHDGVVLEAAGEVTLTAESPALADPFAASFPAVVNHVVYFGDGISSRTILRGFRITGANNYQADAGRQGSELEPALDTIPELSQHLYFYSDGGGIKIFGRSYPTLENLEIFDNFSSPCGAGVSIEHRGFNRQAVTFRNIVFRDNRVRLTGAAVDLLYGSAATFDNCLFVGNVANAPPQLLIDGPVADYTSAYNREHGSGALTLFDDSRVRVTRSTFTGNWNGVDDRGSGSVYETSIFWRNDRGGGRAPGARYELDVPAGTEVRDCWIGGGIADLRGSISRDLNHLDAPDPRFEDDYRPRAPEYEGIGYRPIAPSASKSRD
jgi:hypothetical protein